MALSHTVTYAANGRDVWRTIVRTAHAASYPVVETAEADRRIVYQATGGMWANQQTVRVSVSELGEGESAVTVHVGATTAGTLAQGGQQRKLIEFVFDVLDKQFERGEGQPEMKAPGTSGCAGAVLLFLGLAVVRLL